MVDGDGSGDAAPTAPGDGGGLLLAPAPRPLSGASSGWSSSAFLICCTGCGANSATEGGVWAREVRATAATSTERATTIAPRTSGGVLGRLAAATRSPPFPSGRPSTAHRPPSCPTT